MLIAGLCTLIAAVSGGVVLGWWLATGFQSNQVSEAAQIVEVRVPVYGAAESVPMPDVRGLTENAAREVMADIGIPADVITGSPREGAGEPGVVIEQTPAFGTKNPDRGGTGDLD